MQDRQASAATQTNSLRTRSTASATTGTDSETPTRITRLKYGMGGLFALVALLTATNAYSWTQNSALKVLD